MKNLCFIISIIALSHATYDSAFATNITTSGGKDSTDTAFTEQPTVDVTGLAISDTTGLQNALDAKVNAVSGKDLSTNDFTNDYKTAIDNLGTMANETKDDYYTKSATDTLIGDPVATTNGNITAGNSINANLTQIATNMGALSTMGGNNVFKGNTSNITLAVRNMADSVSAGMGGTFASDGTWSGTVTTTENTDYTYNTPATNILTAVNQVASNVGGAVTSTNNISTTNTVNANLSALDTAIGNKAYTNNKTVNYNAITSGTDVTNAISQIASNIGSPVTNTNNNISAGNSVNANLTQIATNMGALSTLGLGGQNIFKGNTSNITLAVRNMADSVSAGMGGSFDSSGNWSGNVSTGEPVDYTYSTSATTVLAAVNQVASNVGTAVTSTNNISTTNTVNQNLSALDSAIGDMDFSGTKHVASAPDLSDAIRTLDGNLNQFEHRLNSVEYNMKSGLAAVSALSALVPNARDCGNTQLSVGTGVYSDRVGVALGGFHYFNDHILMNAGASYGGTKDWAFRAGVTFGI